MFFDVFVLGLSSPLRSHANPFFFNVCQVEYREEREREDQHAQHPTRMSLPGGSTGMPTGLSSGRITHNVKELGKALVRGCVL